MNRLRRAIRWSTPATDLVLLALTLVLLILVVARPVEGEEPGVSALLLDVECHAVDCAKASTVVALVADGGERVGSLIRYTLPPETRGLVEGHRVELVLGANGELDRLNVVGPPPPSWDRAVFIARLRYRCYLLRRLVAESESE